MTEHEIKVLREELLRDFAWLPDGRDRLNRLCDMARRYLWLRDRAWPFEFKGDNPEDADAAIDKAMLSQPQNGEGK